MPFENFHGHHSHVLVKHAPCPDNFDNFGFAATTDTVQPVLSGLEQYLKHKHVKKTSYYFSDLCPGGQGHKQT